MAATRTWRTVTDMKAARPRVLLAAALVAVSFAASMSLSALTTPRPAEPVPVAIVGDSLTKHSLPFIPEAFAGTGYTPVFLLGRSGYMVENLAMPGGGLDTMESIPDTVLIALGTVDMRTSSLEEQRRSIDNVLSRLGPDRRVVWVNTYRDDEAPSPEVPQPGNPPLSNEPDLDIAFNQLLAEAQTHYPNMEIADWRGYVESGAVSTTEDGIHYRDEGYRLRALFYKDALLR